MPARNVVIGQRVMEAKATRARQFRREMTPAERVLWHALRGNRRGGLHFRRQQVIDGLIVDFYCHAAGLVIEVDGPVHADADQRAYDAARDAVLTGRGLRILRITNADVLHRLEDVLARIDEAAARSGPTRPDELHGQTM
jgi:very-short-patch-repair endonuclease